MKTLTDGSSFDGIVVPEDAVDRRTAASLEPSFQKLANRTRLLFAIIFANWTIRSTSSKAALGIVHGTGHTWVAVGSGAASQIMVSTDGGITWTVATSTAVMNGVAHDGSGLFVAVGVSGSVYSSPDGSSWTSRSAGASDFHAVAYASGHWIAVGAANYVSTNGTSWSAGGAFAWITGLCLAYSPALGRWVAGGSASGHSHIERSNNNGTTWTTCTTAPTSATVNGIVWCASRAKFYAVADDGTLWTSADGDVWTSAALGFGALNAIAEHNGDLVVAGASGLIITSFDGGATWTQRMTGTANDAKSIAYGEGAWLAGTSGEILTSLRTDAW